MGLLKKKDKNSCAVQTAQRGCIRSGSDFPIDYNEKNLYDAMRRSVPVIDAAITKIIRLTGGYRLAAQNEEAQHLLDDFLHNVPVGLTGKSLFTFTDCYLDSLLTYGNAVGEIVLSADGLDFSGLYNGDVGRIEVRSGKTPFERKYLAIGDNGEKRELENPGLVVFTALGAPAGKLYGNSVLRGLPSLSGILLRIYECIGQNFERAGNVRYAVTCKPSSDGQGFAKERAEQIASEWSDGMAAARYGEIRDFIAVGDIEIKAIGADNQMPEYSVPIRTLLEQLIAKLGIPPFLLGLSWSSTERMSGQQCDILTSELEYYRRLLTPVIVRISELYLRSRGFVDSVSVEWDNINLQDETELARARLYNAQAAKAEAENAIL